MINTEIPLYGIFIIISFICGLLVIYRNTKLLKYKKEERIGLLIYVTLGAVFGAKYFTFITNFEKYKGIFNFFKIGLSSYGAAIGIFIMLLIFTKQFKKNYKDLLSSILSSIPLMYSLGKIGCFLSGCCYGIKYNGPFKIMYHYSQSAPNNIYLFPIQLLEAITYLLLFIYLNNKAQKGKSINKTIGLSFILCGFPNFSLITCV